MARGESNRRVFLIGFMGAGKTSVGQALARKLGWSFRDLDRIIEAREQKTVAEIFAELGEAGFRAAESAVLAELLQEGGSPQDLVVALGGGTFAQAANRDALLKANAMTVLLEAPLEELQRRCANDSTVRPLALQEARFAELFQQRQPAYSLARQRVETSGKMVDEVAQEVARILAEAMPEVRK
jgi:shikimate kinase